MCVFAPDTRQKYLKHLTATQTNAPSFKLKAKIKTSTTKIKKKVSERKIETCSLRIQLKLFVLPTTLLVTA